MNLVEIPDVLLPAVEELASREAIPISEATEAIQLLGRMGLARKVRRTGPEPALPEIDILRADELTPGMYLVRGDQGHEITFIQPNPIGCIPYPGLTIGLTGAKDVVVGRGDQLRISRVPVLKAERWEEYRLTSEAENALELRRLSDSAGEQKEEVSPTAYWSPNGKLRVGDKFLQIDGQERAVLTALVKLQTANKPKLQNESKVEDAPKVLRRLVEKFRLEQYVTFPGKARSGGYRTTIQLAPSPQPPGFQRE